jgi:hypothetical protein
MGSTPGREAGTECSLYLLGGEGRILRAGMRSTGPQPTPTIALALPHMVPHTTNFSGVAITSSCAGDVDGNGNTSSCLVTVCDGRLVLRGSTVSGVLGMPLDSVLCVG